MYILNKAGLTYNATIIANHIWANQISDTHILVLCFPWPLYKIKRVKRICHVFFLNEARIKCNKLKRGLTEQMIRLSYSFHFLVSTRNEKGKRKTKNEKFHSATILRAFFPNEAEIKCNKRERRLTKQMIHLSYSLSSLPSIYSKVKVN